MHVKVPKWIAIAWISVGTLQLLHIPRSIYKDKGRGEENYDAWC